VTVRRLLIAVVILVVPPCLFAQAADAIGKIDELHDLARYEEGRTLALGAAAAAGAAEQAELYWRASRATLELGDAAEDRRESREVILGYFELGERYADMAIAADPRNKLGYFWKSANIGRRGQVKGLLNALAAVVSMRDLLVKDLSLDPGHPDAYHVLGALHRELPGSPLSFGDADAAVSLGRMAVDLHAEAFAAGRVKAFNYSYSLYLAKSLWERNWSAANRASGRQKKQAAWQAAKTPLEKGSAYEATVQFGAVSDRVEARGIVTWIIAELSKMTTRTAGQDSDLAEARGTLAGWK
jgi:hypothetical protein